MLLSGGLLPACYVTCLARSSPSLALVSRTLCWSSSARVTPPCSPRPFDCPLPCHLFTASLAHLSLSRPTSLPFQQWQAPVPAPAAPSSPACCRSCSPSWWAAHASTRSAATRAAGGTTTPTGAAQRRRTLQKRSASCWCEALCSFGAGCPWDGAANRALSLVLCMPVHTACLDSAPHNHAAGCHSSRAAFSLCNSAIHLFLHTDCKASGANRCPCLLCITRFSLGILQLNTALRRGGQEQCRSHERGSQEHDIVAMKGSKSRPARLHCSTTVQGHSWPAHMGTTSLSPNA